MVDLDHAPAGSPARRWTGIVALLAALLSLTLLGLRSWRIDYPYSIDFQVYWLAGSRVVSGNAALLYEPGGGPDEGVPLEMPRFEFKNLPILSVAFAPFAALDYSSAKRVFWWISLGALLASAAIVGSSLIPEAAGPVSTRIAWSVALLCCLAPTHTSLRHGQTTPLVLLAVIGYLALGATKREGAAGACLAVAGAVKLPVLLLAGLEAVRRRWKTLAAWCVVLAVTVVASVAAFGPDLHRQYLAGLGQHAGTVMTGHNNQSIAAVAARLVGPAPVYDWEPRPMPEGAMRLSVLLTLLLGGVLTWAVLRRSAATDRTRRQLEVPAVLAFGLIAMPVAWDHYFLLLGPALVMLAGGLRDLGMLARPGIVAALIATFLALAVPTPQRVLDGAAHWGLPGALLLSHYFIGAILVMAVAILGLTRKRRG
jgi:hypothetical protein